MSVLIIDDNTIESAAMAQTLTRAAHRVVQAADMRAALGVLASAPPDLVIMAWPRTGGAEVIKRLRVQDNGTHTYVIVVLDKHPGSDVDSLFAAGADDFIRRPVSREELLGRVGAPQRIQRWASAIRPEGAAKPAFDLQALDGYRRLGDLIATELEAIVGQAFDNVAPGWSPNQESESRAATISMALATEKLELRISILVGARSLKALATILLGDPNAEMNVLDDILREMANTGGGAVKRAVLKDNVVLTTGLPVSQHPAQPPSDKASCWTATIKSAAVRIGIVGEIRLKENKSVSASELEEGMVVARDLRNADGALLVPAGTRLTFTTATRIASIFGEKFVVEVASAA